MSIIRVLAFGLLCTSTIPVAGGVMIDEPRSRGVVEVEGEPLLKGSTADELAAAQDRLWAWLDSDRPSLPADLGLRIVLTDAERAAIDQTPSRDSLGLRLTVQRMAVGRVSSVGHEVDLGGARDSFQPGRQIALGLVASGADGAPLWITRVSSPGASGLRVRFDQMDLPQGAELFMFNAGGQAQGPYTGRSAGTAREQWSHTFRGDTVYVELRVNRELAEDAPSIRFRIAEVAHLSGSYALLSSPRSAGEGTPRELDADDQGLCSGNAPCVVNAQCTLSGSGGAISSPGYVLFNTLKAARKGVALIHFASGGNIYSCTGGLINDSLPGSQFPYFLTANHCISTAAEANSMEAFWQYAVACGGDCHGLRFVPSTLGATVLKTSPTSDYSLLLLTEPPPKFSWFLGWSKQAVAFSGSAGLYRLSHPKGSPLAYSTHSVSTTTPTCLGLPRGSWIYSLDHDGATEPGSSGSPVLNDKGKVVGQLTGSCPKPEDVCDQEDHATVDGALAAYFNDVKDWLDPAILVNPW